VNRTTFSPEINIPRGLVLAISTSIILYILVAISAVSVLGWEELSRSSAPFSDIARYALGPNASAIISIMALFATTNTVLVMTYFNLPVPDGGLLYILKSLGMKI
jgi:APA family basic amino acid/polyamine antiporter